MKELSIEEKAKRYDEVVNKLKGFMAQGVDPLITRADAQDFFPELKENEDESIRKSLAAYFANFKPDYMWDEEFSFGDIVAWLEKQGGHAKFVNGIQVGDKVTRNEDGVLVNLSQLNRVAKKQGEQKFNNTDFSDLRTWKYISDYVVTKWCGIGQHLDNPRLTTIAEELQKKYYLEQKQGEQKPADKVKPKFKVGDWIVDKNGIVRQILSYKDGVYKHTDGYSAEIFEDEWRLWDITKDAKDGDVLVTNSNIIFIFKYLDEGGTIAFRASCTKNSGVYFPKIKERLCDQNVYPATKEQRDLLFQKMKEAGYEWDAEKKELRKIEQKPLWGEEDERLIEEAAECLRKYASKVQGGNSKVYVLSLADRIESLRPQTTWKPNDEQMAALLVAVGDEKKLGSDVSKELYELYLQLKQL